MIFPGMFRRPPDFSESVHKPLPHRFQALVRSVRFSIKNRDRDSLTFKKVRFTVGNTRGPEILTGEY